MKVPHVLLAVAVAVAGPCGLSSPLLAQAAGSSATPTRSSADAYSQLLSLFEQWRAFSTAKNTVVPLYTPAAIASRTAALAGWQARLHAIDTTSLTVQQLTDYRLVQAEMNGMDFDLRVLRPWARDPGFYAVVWGQRTDVPLREGPLATDEIALYRFSYPLSAADSQELLAELKIVPALLTQAKSNLQGSNARDLWVYGAQGLREQAAALAQLQAGTLVASTVGRTQTASLTGAPTELRAAVEDARKATESFAGWLDEQAASKTGPSGVGKENYTWYQQNVHMVPYTWDEQVVLLRRELDRAQASLLLEEHRNRNLPPLEPAANKAAFDQLVQQRVAKFLAFLVDQQIIPDKPYLKEVVRKELLGDFAPAGQRAFFTEVIHREPMLLLSHDYHWIDLGRMRDEPNSSPIRRVALSSNIWDTRAEGFATAFEELVMHAGLYDDNPRAKELVWIMVANRAARGLASLYVQANEMDLQQAGAFHAKWTPRTYSHAKDQLTAFEQLLYLRQPGYGTSYIVGKVELDELMTEWAKSQQQASQPFVLRTFLDRFNGEGMIPIPLMEDEMIPKDALDHPPYFARPAGR